MKLAALLCVGALSLIGCVDDVAIGGGHLSGMRPAKPSIDNPTGGDLPNTPKIFEEMESGEVRVNVKDIGVGVVVAEDVKADSPLGEVCESCDVKAIVVPNDREDDDMRLGEIQVIADGNLVCRLYFDQSDGQIVVNECGFVRQ